MISLVDIRENKEELNKLVDLLNKALEGINAMEAMNEYKELTKKAGIAIDRGVFVEFKDFDKIKKDFRASISLLDNQIAELGRSK